MEHETKRVIDEIKQLISQYQEEVPGKRKQWPQAIKTRVKELWTSGLTAKEISSFTSLPYYTVYAWSTRDLSYRSRARRSKARVPAQFIPIQIQSPERPVSNVTVTKHLELGVNVKQTSYVTVTVTLPNGIRIEGVTPDFLKSWLGNGMNVDT